MKIPQSSRARASWWSSAILAGVAIGCASVKDEGPVHVVRAASDVASCRKVGDVSVDKRVDDHAVISEIADQARRLKADTVLLESGARSGSAFNCGTPSVAGR